LTLLPNPTQSSSFSFSSLFKARLVDGYKRYSFRLITSFDKIGKKTHVF
jgi:hypothetical protein